MDTAIDTARILARFDALHESGELLWSPKQKVIRRILFNGFTVSRPNTNLRLILVLGFSSNNAVPVKAAYNSWNTGLCRPQNPSRSFQEARLDLPTGIRP